MQSEHDGSEPQITVLPTDLVPRFLLWVTIFIIHLAGVEAGSNLFHFPAFIPGRRECASSGAQPRRGSEDIARLGSTARPWACWTIRGSQAGLKAPDNAFPGN